MNDQEFEAAWWGNCANTYSEDTKQLTYAHRMGLVNTPIGGHWPVYDLQGKNIMDIGGGPSSLLLKCINGNDLVVLDPCNYPFWVFSRYEDANIDWVQQPGDIYIGDSFDEVWIYNCLQHTDDPKAIIENAWDHAPVIRIFEWIDVPVHPGHPSELKEHLLNEWLWGVGTVEEVNENSAVGKAYYGVFTSKQHP